jgi:hypothetical protein
MQAVQGFFWNGRTGMRPYAVPAAPSVNRLVVGSNPTRGAK